MSTADVLRALATATAQAALVTAVAYVGLLIARDLRRSCSGCGYTRGHHPDCSRPRSPVAWRENPNHRPLKDQP